MPACRASFLLCGALGLIAAQIFAVEAAAETLFARAASGGEFRSARGFDRTGPGELWDGSVLPPAAEPLRWGNRCRRWREMASGLGETYAGHSLRSGLVDRHCAMLEATGSHRGGAWGWPWTMLEAGHGLPPRLLRRFGEWEVRCRDRAVHTRCALIQQVAVPTGSGPLDLPADAITTHFVIDRVVGREILLWRLFVPMRRPGGHFASAERSAQADTSALAEDPGGPGVARAKDYIARLSIDPQRQSHHFTVCRAGGCMLEIGGPRAGRIATRLAAPAALSLDLVLDRRANMRIEISPDGFAAGLRELMRQRRLERAMPSPE